MALRFVKRNVGVHFTDRLAAKSVSNDCKLIDLKEPLTIPFYVFWPKAAGRIDPAVFECTREIAASIKAAGIDCVIAKSFARIFYRNAINIGLPILECPAASEAINEGDVVAINFDTGVITDETTGQTFQAAPFPPFIQKIIKAGGLMKSIQEGK